MRVGRLLKYLISLVHTFPRFLLTLRTRSMITTTGLTFRKKTASSFAERVLLVRVDTKPRGIETTSIISGDRGQPHVRRLVAYC